MSESTPVAEEDARPNLVRLFEKIGLVKGAQYKTVVMAGIAGYIGPVAVDQVYGCAGSDGQVEEAVIRFTEPGTSSVHYVRWSQIGRLSPV